jgi:hypothetical protein
MKVITVFAAVLFTATSFAQTIPASEIAAAENFVVTHSLDFNNGQRIVWVQNPKKVADSLSRKNVNFTYAEFKFHGRIADLKDEMFSASIVSQVGRKIRKPFRFCSIKTEKGKTFLTVIDGDDCP